jgi:integrase
MAQGEGAANGTVETARRRRPKHRGLIALDVERAKEPGYYSDGGGLYLLVGPRGTKSWIFRYRVPAPDKPRGSRLRYMGLGSCGTYTLAEARERAREFRKLRDQGNDPVEMRKADRQQIQLEAAKAMTFKQCAAAYIKAHGAGWRNPKHAAQWPATLATYVEPIFGAMPVQAVDVGLVMKAVEPIWTVKPETAGRVRGRIEAILDWATARGYRQGENPARWRGHLENLLPKRSKVRRVEHHAALPYAELADFMAALREQEGVGARALEFAILTAARTGEVIGGRWEEINLAERLWTIPAARMKAGTEHRVPLPDRAIEILDEMRELRQSDYVFPGAKNRRPLSNMAFLMLLRRMGRADLTAHGFRSTFSDWCSERTNFPSEVREMALAHAVGDKVEAAYRRGDLFQKRRQVMDAWAKGCAAPVPPGRVVPFAATR